MKDFVKRYYKSTLKTIAFVLIFLIMFFYIQDIFELKGSGYGKYSTYHTEEENSLDVIFFGNSRCNRAINPLVIDDIAGTYSFNYGIQGLRANHVYYRFLDAFKTQKPKLVVIESSIYLPSKEVNESSYLHRTLVSLPTSLFKIKAAMELGDSYSMKLELMLPLLRFHSRFREIESVDYIYNMDIHPDYPYDNQSSEEVLKTHRGYTPYPTDKTIDKDKGKYFTKDYSSITEIGVPDPEADDYFKKMVNIAKENGCKVLVLSIPSAEKNATAKFTTPINNYLREFYADDPDVQVLDLSVIMQEIGLSYKNYHNEGHVNRSGAKLISNYVGEYIKENYDFMKQGED